MQLDPTDLLEGAATQSLYSWEERNLYGPVMVVLRKPSSADGR